jgi:hypothetical protein
LQGGARSKMKALQLVALRGSTWVVLTSMFVVFWGVVVSMSFLCPGGALVPSMPGSCHSWNSTFGSSSQKMQMQLQGFGLGTWADPELVLPSIVVSSSSLVCCYWGGQHICPFGHNGFAPTKFHLLLAGTNLWDSCWRIQACWRVEWHL